MAQYESKKLQSANKLITTFSEIVENYTIKVILNFFYFPKNIILGILLFLLLISLCIIIYFRIYDIQIDLCYKMWTEVTKK